MGDERPAAVIEELDNSRFIVRDLSGEHEIIGEFSEKALRADISVGDLVAIDDYYSPPHITEILKKDGRDRGNLVGVIEDIQEDTLIVKTEHATITVVNPDENVKKGYTIELTSGPSFRRIISHEPVDSDSLMAENDEYESPTPESGESIKKVSFEDIGGLKTVKERLIESVIQLYDPEVSDNPLSTSTKQGILFYGPPGTGKTMMAKAVANELEGSFFSINGPEVVSKHYGESERQIRDIFQAARDEADRKSSPAVIFIDEIDSLTPPRDHADETERRIVAQFLTELDGLENRGDVIVIGATNIIDGIDRAIRRSGRFDEKIEFTKPNEKEVLDILQAQTKKVPLADGVNLSYIASESKGWTGADLNALVEQASSIARNDHREEIHQEDFLIALERKKKQRQRRSMKQKDNEE